LRVWGAGFGVWGSRNKSRDSVPSDQYLPFSIESLWARVEGSRFPVWNFGFTVTCFVFRVQSLGYGVGL
jgi:hypothetical protein